MKSFRERIIIRATEAGGTRRHHIAKAISYEDS
jgi:hypothetical protein